MFESKQIPKILVQKSNEKIEIHTEFAKYKK